MKAEEMVGAYCTGERQRERERERERERNEYKNVGG